MDADHFLLETTSEPPTGTTSQLLITNPNESGCPAQIDVVVWVG